MQLTRRLVAQTVALALTGCGTSPAASSDPSAWAPARSQDVLDGSFVAHDAAPVDGPALDAALGDACRATPPYDENVLQSSAETRSHRTGEPCLAACHEPGGSAKAVFAAAGSIYRSQTSREPATSGRVNGIGGTTLSVDRCGNFYAAPGQLETGVQFTQPFVQNPTFRRMDKALARQKNAGSCNQSGCHDFSGKLRWGVYF